MGDIKAILSSRYFIFAALFGFVALLNNWPVLVGRVPLATDIILRSPPLERYLESPAANVTHAEMSDTITQFYQWRAFAGETLRRGVVPLWNPNILSGTPFLAEPQSALFYPPNWSFALLAAPAAWALTIIFKPALAGFFTALLAKAIGATTRGAAAAGLIFAFSGFLTAWQGFPHSDSAVWMPLAAYSIYRLRQEHSFRSIALTALSLAMPVLGGHPGMAVHGALFAAFYALWQFFMYAGYRAKYLGGFVAAGVLAVALSAIQWLPTIEWVFNHLQPSYDVPWGPLPGRRIFALFSRDLGSDPNSSGFGIPVEAVYAGAATLLLAPLALFHNNRKEAAFFTALSFISAAVAYGLDPFSSISMRIPVYNALKKEEALALVDLALAVLAGLGISALELRKFSRAFDWRRIVMLTVVLGAVAASTIAEFIVRYGTFGSTPWWRSTQSFGFLLAFGIVFVCVRMYTRVRPQAWATALCVLIAIDMLSFSHAYAPFQPVSTVFPPSPAFDFLRRQERPFRVATVDSGAIWEPMYGLQSAAGYDFPLKRFADVMADLVLDKNMHSVFVSANGVVTAKHRIVDMLNVQYFIATSWNDSARLLESDPSRFRKSFSEGHVDVFENLRALPRAWVVSDRNIEVLPADESQLARLRDESFDPASSVILPERPKPFASKINLQSRENLSPIRKFQEDVNEVSLTVDVNEPSILVLSQIHHPGWVATIDGTPADYLRANYTFSATHIDSGVHDVRFAFRPRSFRIGATLSVLSLLIMAFVFGATRLKKLQLRGFA